MPLEIRILSGARAGNVQRFTQAVIAIGRQAGTDLRFDPLNDLDVSGRHAEIRGVEGHYAIFDQGSTNGTFVNGQRVEGSVDLKDGDLIMFGSKGPEAEVRIQTASDASLKQSTEQRIAVAVTKQTAGLKRAMIAVLVLLLVGAGGAIVYSRRHASAQVELLQK